MALQSGTEDEEPNIHLLFDFELSAIDGLLSLAAPLHEPAAEISCEPFCPVEVDVQPKVV